MEASVKKTRRRYSDREKALALALYDACGNLTEVSKACGIPDSTLSQWINGKAGVSAPEISLMRNGIQLKPVDLAARFDEIAHLATGEVVARLRNSKQAGNVPMPHLLRAAEVSVDKSQLLRGQPTGITESVDRHALTLILQDALDVIDVTPE
jgi:hypothetical protein